LLLVGTGLRPAKAQDQTSELTAAQHKLEEGRTALDEATLSDAEAQFEQCAKSASASAQCEYGLARVAYYRVLAAESRHDKHSGERWIDPGIAHAQRSISLNEPFAEAHSILADLYAKKITGMFSGMKFGPKASAENQRALSLNPKSAVVQAALGREYMFKPKAFGGDINKSVEALQSSVQLDPDSDEAWVWLSIALRKRGDEAGSDKSIHKALTLNPRSVFAQRVKSGEIKF
jgi:tetratricopeptide (TPR) repeat protein